MRLASANLKLWLCVVIPALLAVAFERPAAAQQGWRDYRHMPGGYNPGRDPGHASPSRDRLAGMMQQNSMMYTTMFGIVAQQAMMQEALANKGKAVIAQGRATTRFPKTAEPQLTSKLKPEVAADPQKRKEASDMIRDALTRYETFARKKGWPTDDLAATMSFSIAIEYALFRGSEPLPDDHVSAIRRQFEEWLLTNPVFQGFSPMDKELIHEQLTVSAVLTNLMREKAVRENDRPLISKVNTVVRNDLTALLGAAPDKVRITAAGVVPVK